MDGNIGVQEWLEGGVEILKGECELLLGECEAQVRPAAASCAPNPVVLSGRNRVVSWTEFVVGTPPNKCVQAHYWENYWPK